MTMYIAKRIMIGSSSKMPNIKVVERKDAMNLECSSYEEFQESLIALND